MNNEFSTLKGIVDAERCFRIDFPICKRFPRAILNGMPSFCGYQDGFESINPAKKLNFAKERDQGLYERGYTSGLKSRERMYGN